LVKTLFITVSTKVWGGFILKFFEDFSFLKKNQKPKKDSAGCRE
jgi:hypothetical protein